MFRYFILLFLFLGNSLSAQNVIVKIHDTYLVYNQKYEFILLANRQQRTLKAYNEGTPSIYFHQDPNQWRFLDLQPQPPQPVAIQIENDTNSIILQKNLTKKMLYQANYPWQHLYYDRNGGRLALALDEAKSYYSNIISGSYTVKKQFFLAVIDFLTGDIKKIEAEQPFFDGQQNIIYYFRKNKGYYYDLTADKEVEVPLEQKALSSINGALRYRWLWQDKNGRYWLYHNEENQAAIGIYEKDGRLVKLLELPDTADDIALSASEEISFD